MINAKRKVGVALFLLIIAAACGSSLNLYAIRVDSTGDILWNGDQAYLFLGVSHIGYRVSYLMYPVVLIRAFFGAGTQPERRSDSVTVFRVTQTSTEHYEIRVAESSRPVFYTALHDQIYANCDGRLCRWSGDHFEEASAAEQQQLNGTSRLKPTDFDDSNGWSKRSIGAGPNKFARKVITVDDKFTIQDKDEAESDGHVAVAVYLKRFGQAAERIWYLDGRQKKVSRSQYRLVFSKQ